MSKNCQELASILQGEFIRPYCAAEVGYGVTSLWLECSRKLMFMTAVRRSNISRKCTANPSPNAFVAASKQLQNAGIVAITPQAAAELLGQTL